jgi:hypothetical protein
MNRLVSPHPVYHPDLFCKRLGFPIQEWLKEPEFSKLEDDMEEVK